MIDKDRYGRSFGSPRNFRDSLLPKGYSELSGGEPETRGLSGQSQGADDRLSDIEQDYQQLLDDSADED